MIGDCSPSRPRARSLTAALSRIVRGRGVNPRFIAGVMRHGPRGAAELAETVDRDRAAFIKQYFGVEWPDRQRFDLMINSAIGEEIAVEIILNSINLLEKRKTEAKASV